jgi:hypothetical protein
MGFLEVASALSTVVLIVGAVIEYWTNLKFIGKLTLKLVSFRSNAFERCPLKKLSVYSAGPILVVLGIAGELVFETRAFVAGDAQATTDRLKTGQLQYQNLELAPKAAKAESDLKAQEKVTADAQKQAS